LPHPRAPGLGREGAMALATEATPAGFPDPETAGLVARFGRAQGGEIAGRKHPGRAPVRPPIEIRIEQEHEPILRQNVPDSLVTAYFIIMKSHAVLGVVT